MLTKRTNILFDENMWQKLTALAKRHNTSVGELVRNAVEKQYTREDKQTQEAIEKIHLFRKKYGKKLGRGKNSTLILREMRDERYGKAHLRRLSSY